MEAQFVKPLLVFPLAIALTALPQGPGIPDWAVAAGSPSEDVGVEGVTTLTQTHPPAAFIGPPGPVRPLVSEPVAIVRELQRLQDALASGESGGLDRYRQAVIEAASRFSALPVSRWQTKSNLDAVAVYVLVGGNPETGREILSHSRLSVADTAHLRAAIAYAGRDKAQALDLLKRFGIAQLPSSMRAQFLLSSSRLFASHDIDKSMQALQEVRQLAPSTLIEEAALRRLIRIAGEKRDTDMLLPLVRNYRERFAGSVYAGDFIRNFLYAALRAPVAEFSRIEPDLHDIVAAISISQRMPAYENIAYRGVVAGNPKLTEWASRNALKALDKDAVLVPKFNLYLASSLLLASGSVREAMTILDSLDEAMFDAKHASFLGALREIGARVSGAPLSVDAVRQLASTSAMEKEQEDLLSDERIDAVAAEMKLEPRRRAAFSRFDDLLKEL